MANQSLLFRGNRSYRFEASHSDLIPMNEVSIVEQEALFGNTILAHGHNYKLNLEVVGPIDPATYMIMDLGGLDSIVKKHIVDRFDHRHINHFFLKKYHPITNEWLAQYCFETLTNFPIVARVLDKIVLWDTDLTCCIIQKGNKMVYRTHIFDFTAIHRLNNDDLTEEENFALFGKCTREHGHNYTLKVIIKGIPNPTTNQLISNQVMEERMCRVIAEFDYSKLHEVLPFKDRVATTETFIERLWDIIHGEVLLMSKTKYAGIHLELHGLHIQETARQGFSYFGPRDNNPVFVAN